MTRTAVRRFPDYSLYGEAPREHPGRLLHVETIEARSSRYRWRIDPHRHRSLHQMVLVARGRGVATAESVVAHLEPPALTFVPAGTVHGFDFEPGTLGYVVTLSEELLREAARREPAVVALFAAPATLELAGDAPGAAGLVRVARALAREHGEGGAGRALALEGWLSVLLASVLRLSHSHARCAGAAIPPSGQLVARFRGLIEAGFRSGRSMPDYARALNVSETHLRHACLTATGEPPSRLVHSRILLEAQRQLLYTATPVAEIAYGLGFDDPAYFTRFFTRRSGISPRAYRVRGPQN